MTSGAIFDNFIITDDLKEAEALFEEFSELKAAEESKAKEEVGVWLVSLEGVLRPMSG